MAKNIDEDVYIYQTKSKLSIAAVTLAIVSMCIAGVYSLIAACNIAFVLAGIELDVFHAIFSITNWFAKYLGLLVIAAGITGLILGLINSKKYPENPYSKKVKIISIAGFAVCCIGLALYLAILVANWLGITSAIILAIIIGIMSIPHRKGILTE